MATTAAVLDIMVRANSRDAVVGLKKTNNELQRTERQSRRSEGKITALGRAGHRSFGLLATGAKAGALGIGVGLVAGLKKANDEAREAAKVGRQTAAVLKSTGNAANVSKKQIEGLAESISLKAGIDDEAIQSAENLLLTFTKVRNETGKGNQVFSEATKTITDMSVALGQDLKSSTIQVGKALNDPIKGITALKRVGVTFTAQQQEQIEAMVKSGDVMGAQKKILKELNTEFGGSAAAQADGMSKLKVAVDNLFESIGGPLTSALSKGANALAGFFGQLQSGQGAAGQGAQVYLEVVRHNWGLVADVVKSGVQTISEFLRRNREDIRQTGEAFRNIGVAIAAVFNDVVLPVVRRVWPGIRQIIQGNLRAIGGIIKVFTGIFTADFGKAWEGIKQIFSGALKTVGGIIRAASAPFRAAASAAFGPIKSVVSSVFNGIKKVIGDVIAGVLRRFATLFDIASRIPGIGSKFQGVADKARAAADKIDKMGEKVDKVNGKKARVTVTLKMAVEGIKGQVSPFGGRDGGSGLPAEIDKASREYAANNRGKLAALFGGEAGVLGTAKGSLGKAEQEARKFGLSTTSGFRRGDPGWHGKNRARDFGGSATAMLKFAKYMYSTHGSKLLELIHTPLGKGVKNGKTVPNSFWGAKVNAAHYNHVHVAMQRGGLVPGAGSGDKVPALLEPGEGMINKRAVKAMGGPGAIAALNRAVPRFQRGGTVGKIVGYAKGAGFKGRAAAIAAAVAMAESSGNPRAHGDRSLGGSYGLWQVHHPSHPQYPIGKLLNPAYNARAAFKISGGGRNWNPWTTYRTGAYRPYLSAALAALSGGGGSGRGRARKVKVPGYTVAQGGKGKSGWAGNGKGTPISTGIKPKPITPGFEGPEIGVGAGSESSGPSLAERLAEVMDALREQVAGLRADVTANTLQQQTKTAIGLREAERALADMIAGQLGTQGAQRARTPGTGQLARY